ncbi:mechanosensitive ion channel family protein [Flagellimonas zhangzhouensis]|uniref:Mechanosensitive ion channel n=1 Tax=Flagellimonas zhangzhouensis TaxID=1073328 RepID=A0A1H2YW09_9FLAO|nr:mechanosensitive ion channel domain-containing protein [Allomuricauda zhangzhouensis]SDR05501.1 Mechanosensitive ion channel [Allomuricauda zhangzhouensis]SDX09346.1 Mechanosensitive ion channel [Allomuricauda zhangzhouensis]
METINNWKDVTLESLSSMGKEIAKVFPKILGAIVVLIVGWLFIKLVLFLLGKILKLAKVDMLNDKINGMEMAGKGDFSIDVIKIILGFVKWLLVLAFLIVAADILNWTIISVEIGNLLHYLPRFFSALVLLMIGFYIGNFVKSTVKRVFDSFEFGGSNIVSNLLFYVIVIFMSITALNQAGVDTTIITNNITMVLGSFLLAFSLGIGLGSRDVVSDILKSFYTRKNYAVGDKIVIGENEGVIEAIENNSLTLLTETGKFVIPIKDVVSQKVEIKSQSR